MVTLDSTSGKEITPIQIRPAVVSDLPFLPAIEEAAGKVFQSIPDLAFIAEDSPLSTDTLRSYLSSNHPVWVATYTGTSSGDDVPVAFLVAKCIVGSTLDKNQDGNNTNSNRHLYIAECSVHPSYQRRGIASQLFSSAERYAREQGYGCLTLVTFLDVPWNGRFYRKLGFEETEAQAMGDEYVGILKEEADQWKAWEPEKWRRGVMVRTLV